jgi:hypothetical protein
MRKRVDVDKAMATTAMACATGDVEDERQAGEGARARASGEGCTRG